MKNLLLCSILFCVFALSAFAELTPQDLEKIGEIIDEKTSEIIDEKIQDSETRMKTHVTQEREKLEIKILALDKLIERNFYFLIGLIALIAVVIAIPYRKEKKQDNWGQEVKNWAQEAKRLNKEMETQQRLNKEMETQHDNFAQEVERLTKEVETLKQQQTPSGS